jgi:hypothetical protein
MYVQHIPYFIDREKYLEDFYSNFELQSACVTDGRLDTEKKYFKIIRDTDLLNLSSDYFSDSDRILFKLSIFDKTFKEMCSIDWNNLNMHN